MWIPKPSSHSSSILSTRRHYSWWHHFSKLHLVYSSRLQPTTSSNIIWRNHVRFSPQHFFYQICTFEMASCVSRRVMQELKLELWLLKVLFILLLHIHSVCLEHFTKVAQHCPYLKSTLFNYSMHPRKQLFELEKCSECHFVWDQKA